MRVLVAFSFCIVAVLGVEELEVGKDERRIYDMVMATTRTCVLEMKLNPRLIGPDGKKNLNDEACVKACVDQKMGVMNEDGTYSLEKILSFAKTPEDRKMAEKMYDHKIKDCLSIVGKVPCKMAACVHEMPRFVYMETGEADYN